MLRVLVAEATVRAHRAAAVPAARGALKHRGTGHYRAERAGGVSLEGAFPQQSGARVAVHAVAQMGHVPPPGGDRLPLARRPCRLKDPPRGG
eukprot:3726275-Lingulodinium_polyedra.AAC.1